MPRKTTDSGIEQRITLGNYERNLARDAILAHSISGTVKYIPIAAALVAAGFLMNNKFDDMVDWAKEGWQTGFGLQEDPTEQSIQIDGYVPPPDSIDAKQSVFEAPSDFYPTINWAGSSTYTIYEQINSMRKDIRDFAMNLFIEMMRRDFDDDRSAFQLRNAFDEYTQMAPLRNSFSDTYTFANNIIRESDSMSQYAYQLSIRERSSRNQWAQGASTVFGGITTGLGAAIGWGTHELLAATGFMSSGEWDGQEWEEAPGVILDPLLLYAWARTDFQTGNWWSTVDSPGNTTFWGSPAWLYDVPGAPNRDKWNGRYSYEEIIMFAHFEMNEGGDYHPFLEFILTPLDLVPQLQYAEQVRLESPPSDFDAYIREQQAREEARREAQREIDQLREDMARILGEQRSAELQHRLEMMRRRRTEEEGRADQEAASNESGRDDYMPGEEPPEDEEDQYGPPRD